MDAGGAAIRGPTLAARGKFRQAFLNDSKAREVTFVAMYETVISNRCGTKNDALTPPDHSIIFLQEALKHGKNVAYVRLRQVPSAFEHVLTLKIYAAHPPRSNDLLRDAFRVFPSLIRRRHSWTFGTWIIRMRIANSMVETRHAVRSMRRHCRNAVRSIRAAYASVFLDAGRRRGPGLR